MYTCSRDKPRERPLYELPSEKEATKIESAANEISAEAAAPAV